MIPLGIQRRQVGLTGPFLEVSVLILLLIFDKSPRGRTKWTQLFLPSAMPSTRYTEEMQRELDEILEECNKEEGHLLRRYRADNNSMWSTRQQTYLCMEDLSLKAGGTLFSNNNQPCGGEDEREYVSSCLPFVLERLYLELPAQRTPASRPPPFRTRHT